MKTCKVYAGITTPSNLHKRGRLRTARSVPFALGPRGHTPDRYLKEVLPMPEPIKRDSEKSTSSQPNAGAPRHNEMWPVKIPPQDSKWHPRAKQLYKAIKESGQCQYYQNSDWAMARIACDLLTICYEAKAPNGLPAPFYKCTMMVAEIHDILKQLGVTEGARRQVMRVELDVPLPEEESEEEKQLNFYADAVKKKVS